MILKDETLEISLNLWSYKGTVSNGFFSALCWRSGQYNKTRKKNEVCELERKRSVLNALLAISLTFPLWNSWLRISHCHCSGSGLCCGAGSVPDSGTSACWGHGHKKKKKNLLFNQKEMGVVHCFEKLSYLHTHSQFSMCCRYCSKKKKEKT